MSCKLELKCGTCALFSKAGVDVGLCEIRRTHVLFEEKELPKMCYVEKEYWTFDYDKKQLVLARIINGERYSVARVRAVSGGFLCDYFVSVNSSSRHNGQILFSKYEDAKQHAMKMRFISICRPWPESGVKSDV